MNNLQHIYEPERLLLVWRCAPSKGMRTRRLVALIEKNVNDDEVCLRYLKNSEDFALALESGFEGYPAFEISVDNHCKGVVDAFMRRLPPRKRDDFKDYLKRHRLADIQNLSDMALLAYTNAKLPSDGFELYPDLSEARPPFELIIEIAGFHYQNGLTVDDVFIGDPVSFKAESDNQHDKNAVGIYSGGRKLGFVDRAQAPAFRKWKARGYSVAGTIERINGTAERPSVYVFVSVKS